MGEKVQAKKRGPARAVPLGHSKTEKGGSPKDEKRKDTEKDRGPKCVDNGGLTGAGGGWVNSH